MSTTLTNLWNDFKKLPWWKKILFFLPLVLSGLLTVLFMISKGNTTNEDMVQEIKKKTDKQVDVFNKDFDKMEKKLKVINKERQEIREEIENAKADYSNVRRRIDNANANDLDSVAAELRADAARRRNRT